MTTLRRFACVALLLSSTGCIPLLVGAALVNKSQNTDRCKMLLRDNEDSRIRASTDEERAKLDTERERLVQDCQ